MYEVGLVMLELCGVVNCFTKFMVSHVNFDHSFRQHHNLFARTFVAVSVIFLIKVNINYLSKIITQQKIVSH